MVLGGSTFAATNGEEAQASEPVPLPKTTQVVTPFTHALTLPDAVAEAATAGLDAVAYQYENPEVVGEYAPKGGESVVDFLANFEKDFGTQPQVTAVVTVEPTASLTDARLSYEVAPEAPELTADSMELSAQMQEQLSAPEPRPASRARLAADPMDWRPNSADVSVMRASGTKPISIVQGYFWHSGSRPNMTRPGFGLEFEVNMYNNASSTLKRPACAAGYKSAFAAQNQNWSWRLVGGNGVVPSISSLGAYADYNDLSDPCNRNSMAIGIRYPDRIPFGNGDYGMYMIIDAPAGTASKSSIQGVVQATSDQACSASPVPVALTDCMGVTAGDWASATPQNRITLGASRGAMAPDYCWISENKGLSGGYFQQTC